uniref:Uncharacterized protein n=1 Tax=Odontella aurita TaxID=265563 RepID=A0A7S4JU39_9STRA|mmetsp:Transcript_54240/g.162382  ORF Transcript_54240/g.162382 Transcript_54240/m.162382 type:complete len:161 (+) Transcript_54240:827-1309(+)
MLEDRARRHRILEGVGVFQFVRPRVVDDVNHKCCEAVIGGFDDSLLIPRILGHRPFDHFGVNVDQGVLFFEIGFKAVEGVTKSEGICDFGVEEARQAVPRASEAESLKEVGGEATEADETAVCQLADDGVESREGRASWKASVIFSVVDIVVRKARGEGG